MCFLRHSRQVVAHGGMLGLCRFKLIIKGCGPRPTLQVLQNNFCCEMDATFNIMYFVRAVAVYSKTISSPLSSAANQRPRSVVYIFRPISQVT